MRNALTHFKHYLESLFLSYSSLLFTSSKLFGCLLFLVTLMQPHLAFTGIISWLTTFLFAKLIGLRKDDYIYPVYAYNSLLVGFVIGAIYKVTFLSVLFTIGSSVITVLLSYSLQTALWNFFKLPVLNIPFTLVGTLIYLAAARYSNLTINSFNDLHKLNLDFLPMFVQGLLKSVGILLFMPYDIVGILILTGVFFNSKIRFFLIIYSYYIGTSILALFKGSYPAAIMDISAFNFVLIGVALGGTFFIPSVRTYLLIGIAVMSSVIFLDAVSVFWSSFGIPVFTLPFSLVVLLFIYVLGSSRYKYMNLSYAGTPELILTKFLNYQKRFDRTTPQPALPFRGEWSVYQPMNGEWTHKGIWNNAIDFVIKDDDNKSFCGAGAELRDYYCFNKPVISPVNGYVIDLLDALEDNPIGKPDHSHSWGNFIIIRSDFGYFVELSHFKKSSIEVKIGDYVKVGQIIGKCGSSGNSAQPHLHMQVQKIGVLAAEASYFYFSSTKNIKNKIADNCIYNKDDRLSSFTKSTKHEQTFHFALDQEFTFMINENKKDLVTFQVKMDDLGAFYLSDGANKLYYGIESNSFVFYSYDGKSDSWLSNLMKAMPRFYLTKDKLIWKESLPFNIFKYFGKMKLFTASFNHKTTSGVGVYHQNDKSIIGEVFVGKNKIKTKAEIEVGSKINYFEIEKNNKTFKLELIDEI